MPNNARGITQLQLAAIVACLGGMWMIRSFVIMPMLDRAQTQAEESAAIASLRIIGSAELSYSTSSNSGFSSSLAELNRSTSGQTGQAGEKALDGELVSGLKNGYRYAYEPKYSASDGSSSYVSGFVITADPLESTSQKRHFFMDQSLTIRANRDHGAGPEDPPF